MKKIPSLGFLLLISFFSITIIFARVAPAYAYTCADNTVVADPDPSLNQEQTRSALTDACASHGGTKAQFTAAGCTSKTSFIGLPTWYKYLQGDKYTDPVTGLTSCHPKLAGISDIWKVVAAVIEILLRVATLIAIGFVVYGGVLYTVSQAQPDKTKLALRTIINALIGLAITIVAAAVVSFIAGRF